MASSYIKGAFQRNYGFQLDKFVPSGVMTLRDGYVLVGQTNLPTKPENFEQIIRIGNDEDIRYEFEGILIKSNNAKRTTAWSTHDVLFFLRISMEFDYFLFSAIQH